MCMHAAERLNVGRDGPGGSWVPRCFRYSWRKSLSTCANQSGVHALLAIGTPYVALANVGSAGCDWVMGMHVVC